MQTALAVVAVVQALGLAAVAMRLAWPQGPQDAFPDTVGGSVVQQEADGEEDEGRLGFRG